VAAADLVLTMTERQRDRCAPLAPGTASRTFTVREYSRLVSEVVGDDLPDDPADRLRWWREAAHRQRPRSMPSDPPEDVPDPIRATWETWVAMAADLDTLADRIATR
jgi:protein-tyrosine phosphatase